MSNNSSRISKCRDLLKQASALLNEVYNDDIDNVFNEGQLNLDIYDYARVGRFVISVDLTDEDRELVESTVDIISCNNLRSCNSYKATSRYFDKVKVSDAVHPSYVAKITVAIDKTRSITWERVND